MLILLGLGALVMMMNRELRGSLLSTMRAFLAPKLARSLVLMALWVAAEVMVARRFSWWGASMITSTVFWFVGSGLVLFMNTPKSSQEEHFFKRNALKAVKLSVFFGVFMNLFVLNLPAELGLQVVLFFLLAMSAVASGKEEFKGVKKLVDGLIGICVVGLVAYQLARIIDGRATIGHSGLDWQFLLPVWLSLGLLPYIYFLGVYSEYGSAFLRTEWGTDRRWGRRFALVMSFGPQSHKLHDFVRDSAFQVTKATSFTETRRIIREFRSHAAAGERTGESSSG